MQHFRSLGSDEALDLGQCCFYTKETTVNKSHDIDTVRAAPDESINLFDSVFYLIIGVSGFDSQLKDESVNFVHDKCNFEIFLQSMPDDILRTNHELWYE